MAGSWHGWPWTDRQTDRRTDGHTDKQNLAFSLKTETGTGVWSMVRFGVRPGSLEATMG